MKKLMALALSLIFVFSMTALAEDDSLKRMTDSGKLILGLDDSFPPMGFNNEKGEIVGFDIDLATEVCARLGVELVLSWGTLRSTVFRQLLCGKPVILIDNGRILQNRLRQTRITLDELMGHLRAKDVLDVRQVQFAILETDGTLSVFPYPQERPASAKDAGQQVPPQKMPVTLIEDGVLLRQNLTLCGRDEPWVRQTLRQHDAAQEETFLLAVVGSQVIFIPKEEG